MNKKIVAATLGVLSATPAGAQTIEIVANGSPKSAPGSSQYFGGHAVVTPLLAPNETTKASLGLVTFSPGARTAWHTHPAGQLLIVSAGQGWLQQEGQERRTINAGDVVWIPAGVKHWHGATATSPMSHYAMTYFAGDKNVDWMEQVADKQYEAP
ncbi:MAG: TetR family transcriptional regulator [Bradyrhizobiaceae bacterium PARB1]|jgi:quercetin dioxygenase-like cupin family protein|nr:MAG: TetR family transcriptional regulator [Bradyrhizobiaceae bacterium PARB1]